MSGQSATGGGSDPALPPAVVPPARSQGWWGGRNRAALGQGLAVAAVVAAVDQASKLWLLNVFHLAERGVVTLAPVLDLHLVRNYGISYGLFQQHGALGRSLLLVVNVVAVVFLAAWLMRAQSRLVVVALALIIGGAVGNSIDRVAYGAVIDFIAFHVVTPSFRFDWYVFNLADAAIVAGVAGLLYDSLRGDRAAKTP
jgi:signal peptidase II